MTVAYVPAFENRASDELEDLAARANDGYDVTGQLWPLVHPSWMSDPEGLEEEFTAFREAVAARDALAVTRAEDWGRFLEADCVSTTDQAIDELCKRADEALTTLRLGRRGGN